MGRVQHNNAEPDDIGEYLSALANAAAMTGKVHAWLVWGVNNDTHEIIGTSFNPASAKVGNEELESWLLRLLSPKINFRFYTIQAEGRPVVLMEISAAFRHPVQFKGMEFIRVGSYKKKLKDFPEKERELWRVFDRTPFEKEVAAENIAAEKVLKLLDYPAYFDLLSLPALCAAGLHDQHHTEGALRNRREEQLHGFPHHQGYHRSRSDPLP